MMPALFVGLVITAVAGLSHSVKCTNGTAHVDTIVVGAGPAGVQLAAFLAARGRNFVVLERERIPGSFFLRYPRHGKLISINKAFTGTSNPEYNLRFDWHSLLSPLQDDVAAKRAFRPRARYHGQHKSRQNVLAGINAPDAQADKNGEGGGGGGFGHAIPHDMPRYDARYSVDYFPASETVVHYLQDYIRAHELVDYIRYNTSVDYISAGPDYEKGRDAMRRFNVMTSNYAHAGGTDGAECRFTTTNLIVATGLSKPAVVRRRADGQSPVGPPLGERMMGWEYVSLIDNFDLTLRKYANRSVLVLGKGNSGFETANSLVPVAANVHIVARSPHRFSWQTHYPPNLRAVNNNFLDDARFLPGHYRLHELDLADHALVRTANDSKIHLVTRADALNGVVRDVLSLAYDYVISAVGFQFDFSIFDPRVRPVPYKNGRYPLVTAGYESVNVPRMWFAGTLQHSRDFRRSSGGVLDGFRYLARATFNQVELAAHGVRWPSVRVHPALYEDPARRAADDDHWVQAIVEQLMKRANEGSGIFLMFGVMTDVIIVRRVGAKSSLRGRVRDVTLFEDVPRDIVPELVAMEARRTVKEMGVKAQYTLHIYTLNIEFGECNGVKAGDVETDPFNAEGYGYFAVSPRFRYHQYSVPHESGVVQPSLNMSAPWAEHFTVEEQLATWYDETEHVKPLRHFVRDTLMGMSAPLPWPKRLLHLYQYPAQLDAPTCTAYVLWNSFRAISSGLYVSDYSWLERELDKLLSKKLEKKSFVVDGPSAKAQPETTGAPAALSLNMSERPVGGTWKLSHPNKNAYAGRCGDVRKQHCAYSDRGFVPHVRQRSRKTLWHCDGHPWPIVPLRTTLEHEYDIVIIGAGPAGVQLAAQLQALGTQNIILLERNASPASFFRVYPRHRYLKSKNKVNTASADSEFNMRGDWHTLLHPVGSMKREIRFSEHSKEYRPFADDFVEYVCHYARHHEVPLRLNATVHHVTKQDSSFVLTVGTGDGSRVHMRAKRVVVASGLSVERNTHPRSHYSVRTYGTYDIDPELYVNKTVAVIGAGTSAYEIAETLAAVTRTTHFLGQSERQGHSGGAATMSFLTGYQEHPGAADSNILDTYSLKSNNVYGMYMRLHDDHRFVRVPETNQTHIINVGDVEEASECEGAFEGHRHTPEPELAKHVLKFVQRAASASVLHPCFFGYDAIILALGWRFDVGMFDASVMPALVTNGHDNDGGAASAPQMSHTYESDNVPNMFFAGELMHNVIEDTSRTHGEDNEDNGLHGSRDDRKHKRTGPGRQWYGIRYHVQALARHLAAGSGGRGTFVVERKLRRQQGEDLAAALLARLQSGAGAFLDSELVDVLLVTASGDVYVLPDVPLVLLTDAVATAFVGGTDRPTIQTYYVVSWVVGRCFAFQSPNTLLQADPFQVAPDREGRHPVVTRFTRSAASTVARQRGASLSEELRAFEHTGEHRPEYDALAKYSLAVHREELEIFLQSVPEKAQRRAPHVLQSGAPNCAVDVLWRKMQSKHVGLSTKDLEWFRGKLANLATGASLPVPLHHVLMDTSQYSDMRGMGLDVDAQFSYLVVKSPREARSLLGKPYYRDLLRRVCNGEQTLQLSDATKNFLSQYVRCSALQRQQIIMGTGSGDVQDDSGEGPLGNGHESDDENECEDPDCAQRADDSDDDEE